MVSGLSSWNPLRLGTSRDEAPREITVEKPFACMECGLKMTLKAAEKASFGPNGCRGCGGSDIDLAIKSEK